MSEKYIIDIILVAIVAISALIAAKKGFFLTLMSIAASVAALIGSRILCNPVALFVYTNIVRAPVIARVQAMLPASLTEDPQMIIDGLLEQLPDGIVALIENYGILDGAVNMTGDAAAFFSIDQLEINYIKPFCLSVLSLISTIVLFYVLFMVLRVLAKLLNSMIYKHKKQPVNRFLGAVLGAVRAAIPLAILVLLLNFAADYNLNDSLTTAVENSKICAWVDTVYPDLFAELTEINATQTYAE